MNERERITADLARYLGSGGMTKERAADVLADVEIASPAATAEAMRVLNIAQEDVVPPFADMVCSLFRLWILFVIAECITVTTLAWRGAWALMFMPLIAMASASFWTGVAVGRRGRG